MLARTSLQKVFRTFSAFQRSIHLRHGHDNLEVAVGDNAIEHKRFHADEVRQFAEISGDKNLIHLDEDYASKTRFHKRIVHGIFVSSMFSKLLSDHFPGCIYMKQDLKFVAPVFINELVVGEIKVKDVIKEKKRIVLETTVTKLEDNTTAITGEAMIYYEKLV